MTDGPSWTQDQLALLGDARLPMTARMIGLLISLHPEGWQVRKSEIAAFMGPAEASSDDTIARHIRRLETSGWVTREVGGRGHPDIYRLIPLHGCGGNAPLRSAFASQVKFTYRSDAELSALSSGSAAEVSPPSSITPSPPPPPGRAHAREGGLDREAEEAIERSAETLNGCRGSLRDYLRRRVDPQHQVGYVQRIVTSLEGADEYIWRDRTGTTLQDGRTKILAAAFNEMLAGDEVGKHFPDAPGGFGNLRSKVRYLVASALGVERDAKRSTKSGDGAPGTSRAKPHAGHTTPRVHVER